MCLLQLPFNVDLYRFQVLVNNIILALTEQDFYYNVWA